MFPDPVNATEPQPPMVVPLLVKATAPVGLRPVTLAVNVVLRCTLVGLGDPTSAVRLPVPVIRETASMKTVRSLGSVPANMIVCAPLVATEKGMMKPLKPEPVGVSRLPILVPSTVTRMVCT